MKSRAAICVGYGLPLEIDEIDVAGPREGEVLIEIKAAGLCHSDYHEMIGSLRSYKLPAILGHEGAGVVVDIGPGVTTLKPGDHVIPVSVPECRQCRNCTSGRTNFCAEFPASYIYPSPFSRKGEPISQYVSGGTFSNFMTIREIAVAKIREDAPFDLACCVGCSVITGVGSAINVAQVRPGSSVVVFGLGGVGLNVIQGARLAGALQIIGVDINPARREMALKFGATAFVNPTEIDGDIVDHLTTLTGGGADFAFECVGNVALVRQAIDVSRPGFGVAVVVGAAPTGQEVSIAPMNMLVGRTFKGAVLGNVKTRSQTPDFVEMFMEGKIDVAGLVTHRMGLEDINKGFDLMKEGKSIRSVILF